MSLQLRYPNITGRTPEERQQQMERSVRSMIDQLNLFIKKTGEAEKQSQSGGFEEMLNSRLSKSEKEFAKQMKAYLEKTHPVGSIYISVSEISPDTLFGGKWEQIQDRFLLAAGSTYAAGATGGEATHTLTTNEMPSHTHSKSNGDVSALNGISGQVARGTVAKGSDYSTFTAPSTTGLSYGGNVTSTGGGAAHNNMPPYLAVYVWKRIE